MQLRGSTGHDPALRAFLDERGSVVVARAGELVDAMTRPAVIAEDAGVVVGALAFDVVGPNCEILTWHTARKWSGVGTALVHEVARLAADLGCERYWVTTTNDNVDALGVYQRRGFRLEALRRGAVDESRRTIKPGIPLEGDYGIPLRDELQLVQDLPMGSQ